MSIILHWLPCPLPNLLSIPFVVNSWNLLKWKNPILSVVWTTYYSMLSAPSLVGHVSLLHDWTPYSRNKVSASNDWNLWKPFNQKPKCMKIVYFSTHRNHNDHFMRSNINTLLYHIYTQLLTTYLYNWTVSPRYKNHCSTWCGCHFTEF